VDKAAARLAWFGTRWLAEWVWLINHTPVVREVVELHTARGEFDYRDTARWHDEA
jgi:hypothetical protein